MPKNPRKERDSSARTRPTPVLPRDTWGRVYRTRYAAARPDTDAGRAGLTQIMHVGPYGRREVVVSKGRPTRHRIPAQPANAAGDPDGLFEPAGVVPARTVITPNDVRRVIPVTPVVPRAPSKRDAEAIMHLELMARRHGYKMPVIEAARSDRTRAAAVLDKAYRNTLGVRQGPPGRSAKVKGGRTLAGQKLGNTKKFMTYLGPGKRHLPPHLPPEIADKILPPPTEGRRRHD
jgi:hypothetical protein